MRDDAQVRRFRVGPGLMRGLAWGVGILLVAAVLGVFAGVRFWAAGTKLADENRITSYNVCYTKLLREA